MRNPSRSTPFLALAALAAACNLPVAIQEPTPGPAATAAVLPTVTPPPAETPMAVKTYTWWTGGLSIQFPAEFRLYLEQKPSVDGVVIDLPNGIAIASPSSPDFVVGIEFFRLEQPRTLHEFVLDDDGCTQDLSRGQEMTIASEPALLFPDTACGPYGSSLLYVARQSMAYRITVESHAAYQDISASVTELLSTILWIGDETGTLNRSSVGEARLLSATEGWVLIGGSLLWTSDGGDSWREITPPEASEAPYLDSDFLDANLGWVAVSAATEGDQDATLIQVLYTQDAGTTWTGSEFEATRPRGAVGGPRNLEFVDPQHGWLTIGQTLTMNSSAADLYRTTDGGLTWERSSLPFDGDTHFITPSIGWIVGSCCTGAPNQLNRTADGGVTWHKQQLATDPVQDDFDYNDYALPVFVDERNGGLAITIRDESYNPTGVALFHTDNSGETWERTATLPTPPGPYLPGPGGSPGGSVPAQFLASDTWIVAMNDVLYRSLDGGATWEGFAQRGLPGFHSVLEFVNADVGWSVVFKNNCGSDCLLLFGTRDGGRSWMPVAVTP